MSKGLWLQMASGYACAHVTNPDLHTWGHKSSFKTLITYVTQVKTVNCLAVTTGIMSLHYTTKAAVHVSLAQRRSHTVAKWKYKLWGKVPATEI